MAPIACELILFINAGQIGIKPVGAKYSPSFKSPRFWGKLFSCKFNILTKTTWAAMFDCCPVLPVNLAMFCQQINRGRVLVNFDEPEGICHSPGVIWVWKAPAQHLCSPSCGFFVPFLLRLGLNVRNVIFVWI